LISNIYGIRVLHQIQGTIAAFSTKIGGISFASAGMTCRTCEKESFRYITATAVAPDRHPFNFKRYFKTSMLFWHSKFLPMGGNLPLNAELEF
jgi:hypothetical protein